VTSGCPSSSDNEKLAIWVFFKLVSNEFIEFFKKVNSYAAVGDDE
jgi:hypothetical protein